MPTVAVLSPGEMGSSVGRVLAEGGARVLTCLAGRGEATASRAREAGFEVCDSLAELLDRAQLVVSVVPPAAAEPLAQAVAGALAGRRPATGQHPLLYLDANSIGPDTAGRIGAALAAAGAEFVDGCIIGGARDLRGRSRFYLAGPRAEEAAALLRPLNVSILGDRPGQASSFKVLYAGVTKSLSALGMELLAGAERLGVSRELMDKLEADWPNVASHFGRTLPGLPPRARRRAQEMDELAATLEGLGIEAPLARGAQRGLDVVAARYEADQPTEASSLDELLRWWVR